MLNQPISPFQEKPIKISDPITPFARLSIIEKKHLLLFFFFLISNKHLLLLSTNSHKIHKLHQPTFANPHIAPKFKSLHHNFSNFIHSKLIATVFTPKCNITRTFPCSICQDFTSTIHKCK